jgi:hypothetical protein
MSTLVFKLLVTPLLIGAVSLAGRRWGPAVSGWLVGLPLTSGPVALFLALDQGRTFAASTSVGIMTGTVSVALFCLTYSWLAQRLDWRLTLPASWLVFFGCTWALRVAPLASASPVLVFAADCLFLLAVLPLLPRTSTTTETAGAISPWWDIPARMLLATAVVLLLTEFAPALGPHLSGLLAPFPIFAALLAAFTQHFQGAQAAARLLRGVVLGLFAFSAFFVVVAALLVPLGIVPTFLLASCVALVCQGVALAVLRHAPMMLSEKPAA